MTHKTVELRSPRGRLIRFAYRDETSDLSIAGSHCGLWDKDGDEYRLGERQFSGTAVDVGAHTGAVTFSLLADNPELRVIAVEPIQENCDLIRETAALNKWTDRVDVLCAAVASGDTAEIAFDYQGDDFVRHNRFIGGMEWMAPDGHQTVTVPAVSVSSLIATYGPLALIVTDCEGGEWELFRDPAIGSVPHIIGEWHWAPPEKLIEALGPTHDLTIEEVDPGSEIGCFWAVAK